jgi:phosphoglycerate dehydrogenase-like enzyme
MGPALNKILHIYLVADEVAFNCGPSHQQLLQTLNPGWTVVLLCSEAELLQALPDIEWLDTWQFNEPWYAKAPRLRQIFTPAAGRERIMPDPRGRVSVTHGAFHGPMIAETMLSLMLHFNRQMPTMLALQQHHKWDRNQQQQSRLLGSQTALILGYGSIGETCARYLTQLGMRVFAYRRSVMTGTDPESGAVYIEQSNLETHLSSADHIVLLLPGGPETHGFMHRDYLRLIKPGAYLYNFGRGTTLLTDDLLWALNNTELAGAGIDVTEEEPLPADAELWDHPNAVVLPHSSCIYADYLALHCAELSHSLSNLKA